MAHEEGMAIARRFTSSNLRILLYRQAEIVCIEHDLDELEQNFAGQTHLHQNIRELMYAEKGSDGHKIWEKIQELDTALERYSKFKPQFMSKGANSKFIDRSFTPGTESAV